MLSVRKGARAAMVGFPAPFANPEGFAWGRITRSPCSKFPLQKKEKGANGTTQNRALQGKTGGGGLFQQKESSSSAKGEGKKRKKHKVHHPNGSSALTHGESKNSFHSQQRGGVGTFFK